jgi:hypothetical protein
VTATGEKAHLMQRPDDRGVLRDSGKEGLIIDEPIHHMDVDDIPGWKLRQEVRATRNPIMVKTCLIGAASALIAPHTICKPFVLQTAAQATAQVSRRLEDSHIWIISHLLGNKHARINTQMM